MLIKLLVLIILLFLYSSLVLSNDLALFEPSYDAKKQVLALEDLTDEFGQIGYTEVGRAKFTFLFWDIYQSVLFTKTGRYDDTLSNDLIYKIEYLKDITAKELIKRTVEQWRHLNMNKNQYQQFIPLLANIWPDIKAGDSLTLFRTQRASVFYFNNKKIGTIADISFSKLFLDIWLSANTSEPELRKDLLGQSVNR